MISRRAILAIIGTSLVASPWQAAAQQLPHRMARIGVLTGFSARDTEAQRRLSALREALDLLGWTEGRNLLIDYRWGAGEVERARAEAAELVATRPELLIANSGPMLAALQRETQTIPIVFLQIGEPVGNGFVSNMARPGGNTTGFTSNDQSMTGKKLQLLKQIAPASTHCSFMFDPDSVGQVANLHVLESMAPSFSLALAPAAVRDAANIEQAFDSLAAKPNGALLVQPNPITNTHRKLITALAAKHRLPALYGFRYFVSDGGLMSYGHDPAEEYRQAATYVDRILRGAKPGDLPIQEPTKFELIVNLKAAKQIGLAVPQSFVAAADELIE